MNKYTREFLLLLLLFCNLFNRTLHFVMCFIIE